MNATQNTDTTHEFMISGRCEGNAYTLWDVVPAPADAKKWNELLNELSVVAEACNGFVNIERGTSARAAVDKLLSDLRDEADVDGYGLSRDSNMDAYLAADLATEQPEEFGFARTTSAAGGTVYWVHTSSIPSSPQVAIDGLPNDAERETLDRVRAAVVNSGMTWAQTNVAVMLICAGSTEVRSTSSGMDLAIACTVLAATHRIPTKCMAGVAMVGQLSLDGKVQTTTDTADLIRAIVAHGHTTIVVPADAADTPTAPGVRLIGVSSLRDAMRALTDHQHHPRGCVHCTTGADPHQPCTRYVRCADCLAGELDTITPYWKAYEHAQAARVAMTTIGMVRVGQVIRRDLLTATRVSVNVHSLTLVDITCDGTTLWVEGGTELNTATGWDVHASLADILTFGRDPQILTDLGWDADITRPGVFTYDLPNAQ